MGARRTSRAKRGGGPKVRYAVVGAGHIVQAAVLPAFRNARRNSELAAIVSGDPAKRAELGARYGVPAYDYGALEECLRDERVDAVYVGLPNDQHCAFTERAAAAGVHVLCEKPMAVTAEECDRMLRAAEDAGVKLMIAYRLHFEAANLRAVEIGSSGRLGTLRLFSSTFTMQVRGDNIRTEAEKGGGPLYDIGIYCIQAARYLFRSEPCQVLALAATGEDPRFAEIEEAMSCVLRFPKERLAAFTCSFGAADVSSYRLVGTSGDLRVEPAYEYAEALVHHLTVDGRTRKRTFPRRDQFAPELLHFSGCIRDDEEPEPSGREGKIDVQIIEALRRSAERGIAIDLPDLEGDRQPRPRQARRLPPVDKPRLVHAKSAGR
jgi:glucose-fructose oxidoreductase